MIVLNRAASFRLTSMNVSSYSEAALPYLTADLPGTQGVIKQYDEDFVVEEMPLYPACGEGTHTYITIEKRGLTTPAAIRMIARALDRRPHEIGYAGLKDAHGVTRQTISIEHVEPARLQSLSLSRIKVLSVNRHTNKLKLGHLAGNRFVVKMRDTRPSPLTFARPIIEALTARGVPNYFGPQRFGARGDNAAVGLAIMKGDFDDAVALMLGRPSDMDHGPVRRARELFEQGDLVEAADAWPPAFSQQARICRAFRQSNKDARRAWRSVDHGLRRLYISAVQSDLFNRILAARIDTLDRLQEGDVAWKHANGASFRVEDAAVEQPRCDAFEISPTGPLFGSKMMDAHAGPGDKEHQVLAASGLTGEQLRSMGGTKLRGGRRPLRVPISDVSLDIADDQHGPFLRIGFALPPGSYATSVMREILKTGKG